jgi:hypothetical protein
MPTLGGYRGSLNLCFYANFFSRRIFFLSRVTRFGECSTIGRLFFFGQFFENFRNSPNFCAAVLHGKSYVLLVVKNVTGNILGDFFTNSSGRSVLELNLHFFLSFSALEFMDLLTTKSYLFWQKNKTETLPTAFVFERIWRL